METYDNRVYYSPGFTPDGLTRSTTASATRLTGTFPDLGPGDTVEVLRTTGVPGGPRTTLATLATYLVG